MRHGEQLPLLHPGWEPGRPVRDRRRPRVRWVILLITVAVLAAVLPFAFRAPQDAPANAPALPPEAHRPAPTPVASAPTPSIPEWDAGGPQIHPATLPNPVRPAEVASSVTSGRECAIDDLSLVADGYDTWMSGGAVSLFATNMTETPCLLGGWPDLRLDQGGRPLLLTITTTTDAVAGGRVQPERLLLRPGTTARTALFWRDYGAAADQKTPQRLTARLGTADRREIPLDRLGTVGPAPFDLIDGGTLSVEPWQVPRP